MTISERPVSTEAVRSKFIDTYTQFQKEVWALGPRPHHKKGKMKSYGVAHQVKERLVDGIDEHVLALLRLHYRRFRLYCVVLEQRAEIGVCGGREFVCGVSGRSSCERGRRREKRCYDTKLFGGYGRLSTTGSRRV